MHTCGTHWIWLIHVGTWLINMCDMAQSSFICGTWLIHVWHSSCIHAAHAESGSYMLGHGWFLCVTWLMAHSRVGLGLFTCDIANASMWHMLNLLVTCDVTDSYVTGLIHMWHDSFICDMTHSYVSRLIHMCYDSFICDVTDLYVTWLIYSFIRETRLIHMRDEAHSRVTWLIHMWDLAYSRVT